MVKFSFVFIYYVHRNFADYIKMWSNVPWLVINWGCCYICLLICYSLASFFQLIVMFE